LHSTLSEDQAANRKSIPGLLEIILNLTRDDQPQQVNLKELKLIYGLFFPDRNFTVDIQELQGRKLVILQHDACSIYPGARPSLAAALGQLAAKQETPLVNDTTLAHILDGFLEYCNEETKGFTVLNKEVPGEVLVLFDGKMHHLETRLTPNIFSPLKKDVLSLTMGIWEPEVCLNLTDTILRHAWYKQKAFYNLHSGVKMNIVASGLFAYFDWYLRDSFGLRMAPCKTFTLALMEKGILRYEG
jgi:hypothetical protein